MGFLTVLAPLLVILLLPLTNRTPEALPGTWLWISASASIGCWMKVLRQSSDCWRLRSLKSLNYSCCCQNLSQRNQTLRRMQKTTKSFWAPFSRRWSFLGLSNPHLFLCIFLSPYFVIPCWHGKNTLFCQTGCNQSTLCLLGRNSSDGTVALPSVTIRGVSHVCHFSFSGVRWPNKLDSSSCFKKQVLNGLSSSAAFFFCLHAPPPLNPQTK